MMNSESFSSTADSPFKITYFTDIGVVQLQKETMSEKESERIQYRKDLKQQIYNESSCCEKLEIQLRNFLCWILYNERDP
jgi:hypothetical protein